jgi:hypothetical protein
MERFASSIALKYGRHCAAWETEGFFESRKESRPQKLVLQVAGELTYDWLSGIFCKVLSYPWICNKQSFSMSGGSLIYKWGHNCFPTLSSIVKTSYMQNFRLLWICMNGFQPKFSGQTRIPRDVSTTMNEHRKRRRWRILETAGLVEVIE